MKQVFSFLLLYILCGCCQTAAQKNEPALELPADFYQVTRLSDLTSEGWYTIGGQNKYGELVYMTHDLCKGQKFDAVNSEAAPPQVQTFRNQRLLWRLVRISETKLALQEPESGHYLTRKQNGKRGLVFKTDLTDQAYWDVRQESGQVFSVADPAGEGRTLSVSGVNTGSSAIYYFDNYKLGDSQTLYFYKRPQKAIEVPGHVDCPKDGQRIVWYDDGLMRLQDGSAGSVQQHVLMDGTLAPGANLDVWTCRLRDHSRFVLERNGEYCGYVLEPVAEAHEWQIAKGYICTTETVPRYLCFEQTTGRWTLRPAEEAESTAHWAAVAAEPQRCTDGNGVCILKGGWTASDLAELDWSGIRCLDLTALSLPVAAGAFRAAPTSSNIPIFVAEAVAPAVPSSWNFVVSCGVENRLLRTTVLADAASFYTDRIFSVAEGQMVYQRDADGVAGWQTLCLPFEAQSVSVPSATFDSYADGELHFSPVTELEGGKPYLIYSQGTAPFKVVSKASVIAPVCSEASGLQGVYADKTLTEEQIRHYFLNQDGTSFEEAAVGSHLLPFRAFLSLFPKKAAQSLPVNMSK